MLGMTEGRATLPGNGCWAEGVFHHLGWAKAWAKAHDSSGRDDKFIAPERLNCRFLGFARNDKGEDGALLKFGGPTNYPNGCRSFLPQLAAGKSAARDDKGEGGASIWSDGSNGNLTVVVHSTLNLTQAS